MVTIVELRIPASQTLFAETVENEPSLEIEFEQAVMRAGIPIRIRGASKQEVERALDSTARIEAYTLISEENGEWVYSLDCDEDDFQVFPLIVEAGGTVLTATLSDETWSVRLRYTDHADVERTVDLLEENDIDIVITAIRDICEDDLEKSGLTKEQYEALELAVERGYFEIPRQVSLMELSEHLDISHQSLSERLRRAQQGLLDTGYQAGTSSERAF